MLMNLNVQRDIFDLLKKYYSDPLNFKHLVRLFVMSPWY